MHNDIGIRIDVHERVTARVHSRSAADGHVEFSRFGLKYDNYYDSPRSYACAWLHPLFQFLGSGARLVSSLRRVTFAYHGLASVVTTVKGLLPEMTDVVMALKLLPERPFYTLTIVKAQSREMSPKQLQAVSGLISQSVSFP